MKIKISSFFIFALVIFGGLHGARAQELTQVFKTPEGFSIKLPADWKRIDKQTIDAALSDLAKDAPNARPQNGPSDGFQPKSIVQGFGYPRILVIPNKISSRKISEQEFKQYAAYLKQQIQKSANAAFDKNSSEASVKINDVSYDEKNKMLQMITKMSVPNFGLIQQTDTIFLAESGMVTFQLTFLEKESGSNSNLFSNIIRSIEAPKSGSK